MNTPTRKSSLAKTILASATLIFLSGCTTSAVRSPNFYPNERLRDTSKAEVHEDVRYCLELADRYIVERDHFRNTVRDTATQSVIGTAAGAVGGAIVSNAGRGAGIGAASGAIIGLINSLIRAGEPDPNYERFAEQCLTEKGYQVYGWS